MGRLQKQTNCAISLPKSESSSREVVIEGERQACRKALKQIHSVIHFQPHISSTRTELIVNPIKPHDLNPNLNIEETIFFPCSPGQPDPLERFLQWLQSARETLDVCVFSITDDRIAKCLAAAVKRGVRVRVLTDDDQAKTSGSDIEFLKQRGCQVRMDNSPAHLHHKVNKSKYSFV